MHNWPLNTSNFTWLDRLKICSFFLNPNNFWTQSEKVKKFEKKMASFMSYNYAVFTSSGSAANTILAMYLRDKLKKENSPRNIIVLPSTTWTTSASPWIREGFVPYFIDISLDNFGIDLIKLSEFLTKNNEKVAAIFPTSLLGFNLNYKLLNSIKKDHPKIEIFIDQCENNFAAHEILGCENFNEFTCTTSTYMGHEIQSVEGGFIFTNNQGEYEKYLIYRNHGMVRSLNGTDVEPAKQLYENKKVDSRFDFYCLGNNFRNSDIHAFIGLLDLKKGYKYIKKRRKLYGIFQSRLNQDRYLLPPDDWNEFDHSFHVPFCIPIICKDDSNQKRLSKVKEYCISNWIETRPIISGFLGYQTAYQGLMDEKDYPNSIFLHNNGIYIGLNTKVKKRQILKLVDFLNKI